MSNSSKADPPLPWLIARLWRHIDGHRRGQLGLLLLLMVLTSFAEALSIGAVLPFLGALTQPAIIFDRPVGRAFADWMSLTSPNEILLPLTVAFCLATLLAGATRVLLLWASTRLSFALGSDLSNKVYRNTLRQPYSTHIARNSSEVINTIWSKVSEVIFFVLSPLMIIISSIIIIAFICLVLFATVPGVALLAFGSLGLAYAFIVKIVKRRLGHNSQRIAEESTNLVKTLQEGLGGIRDVIIDGSQETFSTEYRTINRKLRQAQGENQIMGQSPRYVIEAMGMLLIAVLAYILSKESPDIGTTISTLAAMALGMQRLLPAAQQLYSAWSNIHGTKASLRDVLEMLDQPLHGGASTAAKPLPFDRQIALKNVSFRYHLQSPWILRDVDLSIPKGARIGFIGPTGCGKSTLLDIVMGLLEPTDGALEIDGTKITAANCRSWQFHIAHVPQSVFLADSSIAENIAFGVPSEAIDLARVEHVAGQAQLAGIIEQWPLGYNTRVGERGVQLSGGQRQRIGIARALYKDASVIVFDEATSALDGETEQAVMLAIEALGKDITVLMIAHRVNTLRNCTEIVELGEGTIIDRRIGAVALT